jgi:hypothetical protein
VDPVRWTAVGEDFALLAETKRQVSFAEALSSASLGRRRMVVREFELAGRPQ